MNLENAAYILRLVWLLWSGARMPLIVSVLFCSLILFFMYMHVQWYQSCIVCGSKSLDIRELCVLGSVCQFRRNILMFWIAQSCSYGQQDKNVRISVWCEQKRQHDEDQSWVFVESLLSWKTLMHYPWLVLPTQYIPLPLPKFGGDMMNLSLESLLGHVNGVGGFWCNCCLFSFMSSYLVWS